MADQAKKKARGNYCVAGGPNMTNCENNSLTPGISTHYFPKDETLRKKWTLFVRVHRKDFVPSKSATLCSVHFDEKCFESKPVPFTSAETGKAIQPKRYLIKGSVRTRYAVVPHSSPITSRKRRRVSKNTVRISWFSFVVSWFFFYCMKLLQFYSAHWSLCVYCIALFLQFNCYPFAMLIYLRGTKKMFLLN